METSAKNLVPKSLLEQHKHRLSLQDKANDRENELINKIKEIVKQEDIALISHYYTDDKIQKITEDLGGCVSDSLQMAKYGKECNSNSLVVSGVKFMGETAKQRRRHSKPCPAGPVFVAMLRRRLPCPPKASPMLLAGCPECTGTIPIYHSHRLN